MRNFFKTTLVVLIVVMLLLIPPVVALLLGYPVWHGVFVSLAVVGLVLFMGLVRFIWVRYRERRFVDGLVGEGGVDEKAITRAQRTQWKEAVSDLKKSHLRIKGNPLYVLPWYMLLGETGTGKSTAIENSKLITNIAQPPKISGLSGTRNCEWWFFNEAVIIDTAGRYATHQDEAQDKSEWHAFLRQLARYRKSEPLNGLVVTVSASTLLAGAPEELEAEGRKIRERTDELMTITGARFPVYLMVTKCDLIQGMTDFCEQLPDTMHSQAFGVLNKSSDGDASLFLQGAFTDVLAKLRSYRLQVAGGSGQGGSSPGLLFFPEEFKGIERGLSTFTGAAFSADVYHESPHFRGLFFSSAKQSGQPLSLFSDSSSPITPMANPETKKSYFLHDFFAEILPRDRHLHVPTRRFLDGKSHMRRALFAALVLVSLIFGGLMSYTFTENLTQIRAVQREYVTYPDLKGQLVEDVNTLERFRLLVRHVAGANQEQLLPEFGLNHGTRLEAKLKEWFCQRFQSEFLSSYDTKMADTVVRFSSDTPDALVAEILPHYIRRINLIRGRIEGLGLSELAALPQPDYQCLVIPPGAPNTPAVLEVLETQYLDYLLWASPKSLVHEKNRLVSWLSYAMNDEDHSMQWLVVWCNSHTGLLPLTLNDFWGGSVVLEDEPMVHPAFTLQGKQNIEALVVELESALDSPLDISKKRSRFLKEYKESYAQEWFDFASFFPQAQGKISGREEGISSIVRMGTLENPYFSILQVMAEELVFFNEEAQSPLWMEPIFELEAIRAYAATRTKGRGSTGPKVKVPGGKGLRILTKLGKRARSSVKTVPESVMVSGEAFNAYVEGLSGLSKASLSPASAFALASVAFAEDPAAGTSLVRLAMTSEATLKVSMETHRTSRILFRTLLHGPFDCLWSNICENTGEHLQGIWDETVLSEVQGVYDRNNLTKILFGKSGYVNKFLAGPAHPFIGKKRQKGYYARTVAGESIPFNASLFRYLTRGTYSAKSEKTVFKVTIEGLPTDVNKEANIQPHMTILELEGAENGQMLTNRNYYVSKDFQWSPKESGNVTLTIGVGDLILEKKYTGVWAFAKFVKAFSRGQHEFRTRDFPREKAALKRMGVRYIRVKYKMKGTRPIIELMRMVAGKPPEVIVACLD